MALALAAVLGSGFLFLFYRTIRLNWPESYFGASDLSAYAVSMTPARFAAYRLVPVFVICSFVAVSLNRGGEDGTTGAVAVAVLHTVPTLGRALVSWARLPRGLRRHRLPIVMLRAATFVAALSMGALAGRMADTLAPLVPELNELTAALWTAVFAGIVGAFVLRLSSSGGTNASVLAETSSNNVPTALWNLAWDTAVAAGADPRLACALMIVENLERPEWFRRLEKWKSHLWSPGTYGIMQLSSPRWISDEESIVGVVHERLLHVDVRNDHYVDYDRLNGFAYTYNPSPNFAELLQGAYEIAETQLRRRPARIVESAASRGVSADGHPVIQVTEIDFRDWHLTLQGTAIAPEGTVWVELCSPHEEPRRIFATASAGGPIRGTWATQGLRVPRSATHVIVRPMAMMNEKPADFTDPDVVVIWLPRGEAA